MIGNSKNQAEIAQQAMEKLAADGLAPTPHHYAVYYHYVAGDIPGLIPAVNLNLASQGKLDSKKSEELYQNYVVAEEVTFLRGATGTIETELRKVMSLIDETTKGANQFGKELNSFSGNLDTASSIDILRGAVTKLADETRLMAAQNQKLQSELENATQQLTEVRTDFDRVHKQSQIDALTEVGNRKFFDEEIVSKIKEAQESGAPLSMLIADIDFFKTFNDTHGHLIGDQVLRLVARTLVENLKGRDVIARYGGEEFVILLPQTKLQDAERVGNFLRAALATKHIRKRNSHEVLGVVTISMGAAEYKINEDGDSLIARADIALYKAKQTGRNKVVCEE